MGVFDVNLLEADVGMAPRHDAMKRGYSAFVNVELM